MTRDRPLLIAGRIGDCLLALSGLGFLAAMLPANVATLGREGCSPELDVAGFSGWPGDQTHATALDGRTGKVLCETAACAPRSKTHSSGFGMFAIDPRTGQRLWNAGGR